MEIPFNRLHRTGKESEYIEEVFQNQHISGNGVFTKRCHDYFEKRYGFNKVLLTTSASAALEMAALLLDIKPGDEIIVPSYTFVTSASVFVNFGAKIVFVDSSPDSPHLDVTSIENLITPKTKAIVPVHYAGRSCDMSSIMRIANKHNIYVIEDAAQAIDSFYEETPLGSIGHLSVMSFHETKNITCGEGGLLVINDDRFIQRAERVWEKGTNRAAFFRGEVNKYEWVDKGSSFVLSEILAAYLYAQLEKLDEIQSKRSMLWDCYYQGLLPLVEARCIDLPAINDQSIRHNAHTFYFLSKDVSSRGDMLYHLQKSGIQALFHYLPLHKSSFYTKFHDGRVLPWSDHYASRVVRLPLYTDLSLEGLSTVLRAVKSFYST